MDLDTAIEKHVEWKLKLRNAIAKQEQVDAITLGFDDRCELGRWLHGEAKAKSGKLASYQACVAKHAAFHKEAAQVAVAINAKRFDEAEGMLAAGSAYAIASQAVGTALTTFKLERG